MRNKTLTIVFLLLTVNCTFSQPNSNRNRLIGVHLCTWQDVDGNGYTANEEFLNLNKVVYDENDKLRVVFYPKNPRLKTGQKYYVKLISLETGQEKYLVYKRTRTRTLLTTVSFIPFAGRNKVEYWVEKEGTYTCEFTTNNNHSSSLTSNLVISDMPKHIVVGNRFYDKNNDGAAQCSEIIGLGKNTFKPDEDIVVVVGIFSAEDDNSSYEITFTIQDENNEESITTVLHQGVYNSQKQFLIPVPHDKLLPKGFYSIKVKFYPTKNEYNGWFFVK